MAAELGFRFQVARYQLRTSGTMGSEAPSASSRFPESGGTPKTPGARRYQRPPASPAGRTYDMVPLRPASLEPLARTSTPVRCSSIKPYANTGHCTELIQWGLRKGVVVQKADGYQPAVARRCASGALAYSCMITPMHGWRHQMPRPARF